MAWFRKDKKPLKAQDRRDVPTDVFDKCKGCGEILYRQRLVARQADTAQLLHREARNLGGFRHLFGEQRGKASMDGGCGFSGQLLVHDCRGKGVEQVGVPGNPQFQGTIVIDNPPKVLTLAAQVVDRLLSAVAKAAH